MWRSRANSFRGSAALLRCLDPVVLAGRLGRDHAVPEIGGHGGRVAPARIADAAAAGRMEEQALTGGDLLQAFALELLAAGLESEEGALARTAALAAARRE